MGEMANVVDKMKRQDSKLLEPTETRIVRPLFWAGLSSIAVGTVLQW
jgi:hypothetical protein